MTNGQMTMEEARTAVDLALAALKQEDHQLRLKAILAECAAVSDPMAQMQLKFQKMLPAVSEILGDAFQQKNPMVAMMQVQAHAAADPRLALDVARVLRALGGDVEAVTEEEEFEEVE